MENTKKLAKDYYNFILKYDDCFYKKYKKEETETNKEVLKIKEIFNEIVEKEFRPYTFLTKGKEIEELEYIFCNDAEKLNQYLRIFDLLSDDCYDLAVIELRKYYAENNINKSYEKIFNSIIKCMETNEFDSKIFSQELIEKCNLMKESDNIYDRLIQAYKNIQESNEEEME